MKTILHTDKFRTSGFLKIINVLFLGLILISGSSFAASTPNLKEGEDSNKVVKHNNPADTRDAILINLPSIKTIKIADREIHMNMVKLIRENTNPTLMAPDMVEADKEINDAFFSNYRLSFGSNNAMSDDELNNLFFAYNLLMPSTNIYSLADNDINFDFYLENYLKVSSEVLYRSDVSINRTFSTENAE